MKHKFQQKLVQGGLIFVFFLTFFMVINWIESFLLEKTGISSVRAIEIVVAAALIAKVILTVDYLPIVHRFKEKPLIYPILWKSLIYWVILFVVRLIIEYFPHYFRAKCAYQEGYQNFIMSVHWNFFLSVQFYYLMLLFIFVAFQEIAYRMGPLKFRKMFFGF